MELNKKQWEQQEEMDSLYEPTSMNKGEKPSPKAKKPQKMNLGRADVTHMLFTQEDSLLHNLRKLTSKVTMETMDTVHDWVSAHSSQAHMPNE